MDALGRARSPFLVPASPARVAERTANALKPSAFPFVESCTLASTFVAVEFPVPASRPAWNGYLKLSFVSCPIALYPATSAAERLSFRQVNRRTGHRLKQKLVDSVTREEVGPSDKARGYETATAEFLLIEDRDIERARSERPPPGAVELASSSSPPRPESPPTGPAGPHEEDEEEIAAVDDDDDDEEQEETAPLPRPQNTRTIEIERFVPRGQVDGRYFEKPYYIAPRGEIGQEAFAVIRDAMAREKVAGLARIILSSRERPFLVEPVGMGLRGVTLRFTQEVRPERDYFSQIPSMKLPTEMMKLAQHIIGQRRRNSTHLCWRITTASLVRILQKKQSKRATPAPVGAPSRENVINLMDALRRSIAAQQKKSPAIRHPAKRRTARAR
jgi:Ku protein